MNQVTTTMALHDVTSERPSALLRSTLSNTEAERPTRRPVECGDLPFVVRRGGVWLYRGSPIGRKELVCLFSSVLKRDEDGQFWLETPVERGRIVVEDAPWMAVELDWVGCGQDQRLTFRTNVDQVVTADRAHPIRVSYDIITCEPIPYLRIRDGAGHWPLEARINRAVYYELAALAEPGLVHGREMMGVWSCGCFFPLGEMSEMNSDDADDATFDADCA